MVYAGPGHPQPAFDGKVTQAWAAACDYGVDKGLAGPFGDGVPKPRAEVLPSLNGTGLRHALSLKGSMVRKGCLVTLDSKCTRPHQGSEKACCKETRLAWSHPMSPKLYVTAGPPGFQGTPLRETSLGSRCRPSGQRYCSGYVKGKQKNHHGVFLKMQVPVSTLRNSVGWWQQELAL